jgi:S-adenosylmethionine:diacylglycerol 3-amino-3-carboxypropyl transferase
MEPALSPYSPPFRSALFYSVQNEDYQTELAVLRRIEQGSRLRVLMVASSGENALSLLTQDFVADVYAVDISAAQLHLCELRRTAAKHLTRDEQLLLLGADPAAVHAAGAPVRLDLFQRLAPQLPEPARTFWEDCRDRDLAFGVQHVGRNDVLMHDIQGRLLAAGFAPFQRSLVEEELPAWKQVYTELMTPAYIRDVFGLPSEGLANRIAGIAGYLGECHFRALQAAYPERNPYLTTVFANAYATAAGEEGLPLYLQRQGWAALRRLGTERLHLLAGSIFEQMSAVADRHGRFDLISISNIADWMTDEQFGAVVAQARGCLKEGGALLARSGTGSPMIVEIMRQYLQSDVEFNHHLRHIERGPWFRTIAVGFRT